MIIINQYQIDNYTTGSSFTLTRRITEFILKINTKSKKVLTLKCKLIFIQINLFKSLLF
jgi:hypothetical protein